MISDLDPLNALDDDIKEYSTIKFLNKLSYIMILISLAAIVLGAAYTYFALSFFSLILFLFGIYTHSHSSEILNWTKHICDCRESSNNLYRVEVSQSQTTKIFIHNIIFSAFSVAVILNIFLRWPEIKDITTNMIEFYKVSQYVKDEYVPIFLYSYAGVAGLFFIFSTLASSSAQKYITFPYSAYSDLIFTSNWLLLLFSIIIVWCTNQPSKALDTEVWNYTFPNWIVESAKMLSSVMIGITIIIWIVNSRQYRVGYSLFFLLTLLSVLLSTGLSGASWHFSRELYLNNINQPQETTIFKIASIHKNDLTRYGCHNKYLDPTLNCVPGTNFKIWEADNNSLGCVNLACSTSAAKVESDRYFDLSNILLFSTFCQIFVMIGLYNFSFNFIFVYNDGKKTKDYVWLTFMFLLIAGGIAASMFVHPPDFYLNSKSPIFPYKTTTNSPLSGLKSFNQYFSASLITDLENNLPKSEFSLTAVWNSTTKTYSSDNFLIIDQATWVSPDDNCLLVFNKANDQISGRFLQNETIANCLKDRWIFRILRSEFLSSGMMIDIQNAKAITSQDIFLWNMVNSKLLEPIDTQLQFFRNFTLYTWNELNQEIEFADETNVFDDVAKSIPRYKEPVTCLYSDQTYKNTIAITIGNKTDDSAINAAFEMLQYQFELRDIKTYQLDKSEFKKEKLLSLIKSM